MKAERRYSCAIFALWSLVVSVGAYSGEIAHPMPTSGQCSVPADPKWTMAEKFVWQYVCIGEIANFNEGQKWGGDLDPKKGLPESRILSSTFLETILFADNYRHALTPRGVRIIGARFAQTLDLESTELEHDVWLAKSLFEEGVNFRRLKSTHVVLLTGSRVTRELNLEGLQVDQQLIINNAEFEAVDLKEAHIGGEVNLMGSVAGALDEDGLKVDQGLLMGGNAQFGEVVLRGAHIGGQVNLSGSKVIDKLDMNGLNVDQSLFMSDGAEFKDVDLGYAHVGGSVDLSGSKVTGTLDMEALKVGNDLRMSEAELGDVHLTGAHVSGSLSMDGSKVTGTLEMEALEVDLEPFMRSKAEFGKKVDLSVAHVGGQVTLEGSKSPARFR